MVLALYSQKINNDIFVALCLRCEKLLCFEEIISQKLRGNNEIIWGFVKAYRYYQRITLGGLYIV